MASVWGELKRRNVVRVGIAYAIVAWLLLQLADIVLDNIEAPAWVFQTILLLLILGFPVALIFAWAFELTPEGIKKEKDVDRSESVTQLTGRKLDFVIIGVLTLALLMFAVDKFAIDSAPEDAVPAASTQNDEIPESDRPEMSIAVLPFVNMSSDPEQDFFSDGISEELLNMLAQIPKLRVAARTSSFQFKGMNQDIAKIADTLNVAHILEGSVRKSGTTLRITAQLIKADDGFHLWSNSYDRELDDIFAVQDEIATAISDALKVKLALDTAAGEEVAPTMIKAANTDAYEAYLRGRQLIHRRGRVPLEEAVRHLERSLRLDNNYAPAHAQLAIATALLSDTPDAYGTIPLEEVRRKAIPHLDRAEELEPNLAEAYAGRALLALDTSDLQSAIELAKKAVDLNPSYSDPMLWSYLAKYELGLYDEIEEALEQLLLRDPMTIIGRSNYASWLGRTERIEEGQKVADQLVAQDLWNGYVRHAELFLYIEGNLVDGLSWSLKAHEEDPDNTFSNIYVVQSFTWVNEYGEARRIADTMNYIVDVAEGRFDEAIRSTQRRMQQDPENDVIIVAAADVLYAAGRVDDARPLYERAREFQPEGRPVGNSWEATLRLANSRRFAGDENGAQAAAQIIRQDLQAFRAAGGKDQTLYRTEAMIAAFDDDPDGVIAAVRSALQHGLRDPLFFSDAIFEYVWNEPRFVALQQELDTILATEHEKVLQLICFNNPVPDHWQPLPETCEGVVAQLEL
jgi:TolB-like protein/Tfp pilus assembly protein PilF